ncbi:MAG: terminase [Planctomycetaceae bacterium]|nr:terminase [Planctomycetaceae bacterium]
MPLTDQEITLGLMALDPMYFREHLLMSAADNLPVQFSKIMEPWQRHDFESTDPALKYVAGLTTERPAKLCSWVQRPRGHSKTSDHATDLTWLLWASPRRITGIAAAEDKDQARLVREQMETIGRNNPWLSDRLDYQRNIVRNRHTGSQLEIISGDVASSWGHTHDFITCDEFTHWTDQKFWSSLFSTYAKKNNCLLSIRCNAGVGRGWHWDVRQMAAKNPNWYFSAPEGAVLASWLTPEKIDEQRAGLPRTEFNRLWLNIWQETGGEFVTLDEAEACRNANLVRLDRTRADGWKYVAAFDYAEKHDRTVGVVTHQEGSQVIVDMMDVIDPKRLGQTTRLSWCIDWMRAVRKDFGGEFGQVYFVLDKYQMLAIAQELMSEGFNIEFFDFGSGVGNWEMAVILRQFIIHQKVQWYHGCGRLDSPWGRDDLETELASVVVTPYQGGRRWRFDHIQDDTHHDDRAFALGAACWFIVKNSGGYEEFGFTPPERLQAFGLGRAA